MTGTMIELPRAAVVADKIAEVGEFFSFGTNDLTQTTFGFSRDDAGKFITEYIATRNPESRSVPGTGSRRRRCVDEDGLSRKGAATRSNLKLGICGEHGGDPSSVEFCHQIGLDYVSCSPYRVPIARLAAAQAVIAANRGTRPHGLREAETYQAISLPEFDVPIDEDLNSMKLL